MPGTSLPPPLVQQPTIKDTRCAKLIVTMQRGNLEYSAKDSTDLVTTTGVLAQMMQKPPAPHRTFYPNRKGFGLVESMISIAIIGIILAVAAPSIGSLIQRKKVIAAANELVSVIGYSRSEALAGQAEILVSFDDGAAAQGVSCVQVATTRSHVKAPASAGARSPTPVESRGPGGKMLRIFSIPISSGVTFSTNSVAWPDSAVPGRFSFVWPRLLTDLPETLKITVSGSRGFQLRVDVSSTGQTSVCAPGGAEGEYPACP